MMGMVSGMSGTSFTMTSMQAAQSFEFTTSSSTVFAGGAMNSMKNGMMVMVDATLQPDGSLMATNVNMLMGSSGSMGGGIVTAIKGTPATSLAVVMQNGEGMGMMSSYLASTATIDLTSATTYSIHTGSIDLSGLPFAPVFDRDHIYPGQSVMPVSTSGMMSGGGMGGMMGGSLSMAASELSLMPQGLSGTVSQQITDGAASNFYLRLPSNSAFANLTGSSSIAVYQLTGTAVSRSPIQSGTTVHVFGLLFFDAGEWKMAAARISPGS